MDKLSVEAALAVLEESDGYRILRRVPRPPIKRRPLQANERIALFIDTETTGLDVQGDEVIEIGMVCVAYDENGLAEAISEYSGLREPRKPLPETVSRITGLTSDQLKGMKLDFDRIAELVEMADILIAHNAAFDRPILERLDPIFAKKPWACTATEIKWREYGFESAKLKFILLESGYFYNSHRAIDDCYALVHLLQQPAGENSSAFVALIEAARKLTYRVSVRAHYDFRKDIRARGYRWSSGNGGTRQGWTLTTEANEIAAEIEFLRTNFAPGAIDFSVEELNAYSRYR